MEAELIPEMFSYVFVIGHERKRRLDGEEGRGAAGGGAGRAAALRHRC